MKLPTDEEIEIKPNGNLSNGHFIDGAKWILDAYAKPLAEENENLKKKNTFAAEANLENYKNWQAELTENEKLTEKQSKIMDYVKRHISKGEMWSAVIAGILLDCDFREALDKIKSLDEEGE